MEKSGLIIIATALALSAGTAFASEKIKLGVLTTLEGSSMVLGEDTMRGLKTALKKFGAKAGGKEIQLVVQSTNTTAKSALSGAQKLIDDGVDIIIGPFSSEQGVAIRDFSKTKFETTFINGISGAIEATYVKPSENFFRFNTDHAQWSAGLGQYVLGDKGYDKIAIIADNYAFNHAQLLGFVHEYCQAGGKISNRHWSELGETDFGEVIATIGSEVDAIFLGLTGADAIRFMRQYKQSGGTAKFIGSSITIDGVLLNPPEELKEFVIGMPSSGPQADTWGDEDWQAYVKSYKDSFPPSERFVSPSLLATGYYNAASAALMCLEKIDGNLSKGHTKFRQCLGELTLKAPNGPIKLDENRQAIANNFVTEVVEHEDGSLVKKLVRIRENVNQTLGLSKEKYDELGSSSKSGPICQSTN